MKQGMIAGIAALALAGCVQGERPGGAAPARGDTITYQTSRCFGACPVYSVTVRPDGTGVFTGERFTEVTGERRFTLSRDQYDAFAAALAPYRPAKGEIRYAPDEARCGQAMTDMPGLDVTWEGRERRHLYFYFGCDRTKTRGMAEALGNAADLLPIQNLIGRHP